MFKPQLSPCKTTPWPWTGCLRQSRSKATNLGFHPSSGSSAVHQLPSSGCLACISLYFITCPKSSCTAWVCHHSTKETGLLRSSENWPEPHLVQSDNAIRKLIDSSVHFFGLVFRKMGGKLCFFQLYF